MFCFSLLRLGSGTKTRVPFRFWTLGHRTDGIQTILSPNATSNFKIFGWFQGLENHTNSLYIARHEPNAGFD